MNVPWSDAGLAVSQQVCFGLLSITLDFVRVIGEKASGRTLLPRIQLYSCTCFVPQEDISWNKQYAVKVISGSSQSSINISHQNPGCKKGADGNFISLLYWCLVICSRSVRVDSPTLPELWIFYLLFVDHFILVRLFWLVIVLALFDIFREFSLCVLCPRRHQSFP